MEPEGAKRIFGRSISKQSLRYVNYLGDGDLTSFKTVVNSRLYGDMKIQKLECVGHIQKRLGSRLRKLRTQTKDQKLSDGKHLSGAGRLTIQKIDTLQNYFGLAIRQHKNDLLGMQKSVLATLYHVASTDDDHDHSFCPTGPDSWCKYNVDEQKYTHKHGLPKLLRIKLSNFCRSLRPWFTE